jgi:hypothetical protein
VRKDATAVRAERSIRLDVICVALLTVYFLYFALPARHGGFREDEMMNIWTYWYLGAFQSLVGLAKFWTAYYRPGGALYYLPLYHFFGLDPFPYRIVQICIVAASIPIAYYLARLLASSRSVAFLAVLAFCYHPYVADVVFVGAFIYDVLCGLFYFAALAYYIRIREKDAYLRPLQVLLFLLLYVCALDSKEMAVTLPVIVFIYEVLKLPHWTSWNAFLSWTRRCAGPSLIAGALTGIYLYNKIYGTGSVTRFDAYRPRYSWHNFVTSNATFLGELLYAPEAIGPTSLFLLWAAVFIYAFVRRDRTLQLMAFWVVIVPLPIAFLVPIRSGACLYLLLFGWAMIGARAAYDLIALLVHCNAPDQRIKVALVSVAAISLAFFTRWQNQRLGTVPHLIGIGQKVSHVIAAFDSLNLHPAPHSTVLLKPSEQLFQNKWQPLFIAALVWNDHSLQIGMDKLSKLTAEQLAKVDYIITFDEFTATLTRSPKNQSSN